MKTLYLDYNSGRVLDREESGGGERGNSVTVRVGGNKRENWSLLSSSKPYHVFFHLSKFPSCYVILENIEIGIKSPLSLPERLIESVGRICKENTKYKNLRGVKVDYTLVKNVERGDVEGEAVYKSLRKVESVKV